MRGVPFDIETYMRSVESYTSGRKTVDDIVRQTGMSEATFFNKLHEYKEKGSIDPPKPKPTLKRTQEFCQRLEYLKKAYPNYGRSRLTRELLKTKEFAGQSLSEKTTTRALNQLGLQLPSKKGESTKRISKHNYYHKGKKK